ncbi:metal-sulfur cluster assembly factor [Arachidicoccus terrestris]|uniref:metal-sulfur cluster assembly factor n=1 Tax=Arachidicoccus terrestris TaxID=2875539 RepID=UPI001CC42B0B|nr:iron-sulfur cluster assembly protein [Arachidicoccus terrestris]UAY54696.1 metal-sulfur cluster assembly factor [Arachidicoccus terrestris]
MQLQQSLQMHDPFFEQKALVIGALYDVIDPELFVNIVDLGLVYDIDFLPDNKILITMTLSTPHCPLGEAIQTGVKNRLLQEFADHQIDIEIVWEPAWSLEKISEEGRKMLGMPPRN